MLFPLLALFQCNLKNNAEKNILIGSHSLHIFSKGNGKVAVILDVGIGESFRDWLPILGNVSKVARVVAYDRAGYGASEKGPLPRDGKRLAEELKKLLAEAKIEAPYLLVGHSLGAVNLQIFADNYQNDIAGIVLLDPPPIDWIFGNKFPRLKNMAQTETKRMLQLAKTLKDSKREEDRQRANFFLTLASEHEQMFLVSAREISQIKSFNHIPLVVIASGKPNARFGEDAEEFQRFWNKQCQKLALKSTKGVYISARECSHHIHLDNPDLVLKTILELLEKIDGNNR